MKKVLLSLMAAVLLVASMATVVLARPPVDLTPELKAARTVGALSHFLGRTPDSCEVGVQSRICSWNLSNRLPGYPPLAKLMNTQGRVFMVCELSNDDTPRRPDSCTLSAKGREQKTIP